MNATKLTKFLSSASELWQKPERKLIDGCETAKQYVRIVDLQSLITCSVKRIYDAPIVIGCFRWKSVNGRLSFRLN